MKPRLAKRIIYAAQWMLMRGPSTRGLPRDDCNDAYDAEFERLFQAIGGPTGWMELLAE
jgi:hypothetical protein